MEMSSQIRILKLVNGEHNDSVLYRLQKGWILHFMLGPTLASHNVSIFCNVPNSGETYERCKYRLLKWNAKSKSSGDQLNYFAPVKLNSAGSFEYYFQYDNKKAGSGYFIVDPSLLIGPDNHLLPLDAICMHTVLPKLLGPFTEWKDRLKVSKESGYNAIHFTPIQKLGCSNSSYSLADQLALNPSFANGLKSPITVEDVKSLVEELRQDWMMLSVTDVVWNHTATNSPWLQENPECAFNLSNCPYLRPAYILDRAVLHLSLDVAKGKYREAFPDSKISNDKDLSRLRDILLKKVIPPLKLWEFYQVDVDAEVSKFEHELKSASNKVRDHDKTAKINIIQDKTFKRRNCFIDLEVALRQFCAGSFNATESLEAFRSTLVWLNKLNKEVVEEDMKAAVNNIISTVTYERLADNGPKCIEINKTSPLCTPYFNHFFPDTSVHDEESNIVNVDDKAKFIMAHNGWVMGDDVLKNFAEYPGKVYFRRELVCWGDSVKLRYGSSSESCPTLWQRMKQYTEEMAGVFHGIRIDNCHSTPIHVAEYMLDSARKIRPDLYVFAELFTGREDVDNIFVNRLGITSLIREALNAWDAHELGRLVYMYGGEPMSSFMQPSKQLLKPSRAHALFCDITHDNESMILKRSVHDLVPTGALVAMACCASGSNRGHDEMTPHHIHVVKEQRFYKKWAPNPNSYSFECAGNKSGVLKAKRLLNVLHQTMALNGFNQVFIDQRTQDVVAVTRHNPKSHYSYVMIAHTSFHDSNDCHGSVQKVWKDVPSLTVEGHIMGIALEIKPTEPSLVTSQYVKTFTKQESLINGLDNYNLFVETDLPCGMSTCCEIELAKGGTAHVVHFTDFPPGSVIVLRVKMLESADKGINGIRKIISALSHDEKSGFDDIVSGLDLHVLNRVLFHCKEEELSDGLGIGAYGIPGWEDLRYCGIAGIAFPIARIRDGNDVGHPICTNLREGNWLMDYISMRLQKHKETSALGDWYASCFEILGKIPRYLVPAYFELVISLTHEKLLRACWNQMSLFVKDGSTFIKSLALGTVALCGCIRGANLPPLHPDVSGLLNSEEDGCKAVSMAAGLPHFSSGIMRCWGRDTFIAMHGLQLVTGQHRDARNLILAFAECIRHGLIPNLLGEGKISRYNCRDAVWFWLQCIQDLCECDSYQLLQLPVARFFPTDDSQPQPVGTQTQRLYDVIQEVLQRHVDGISFRERNAGTGIDANMSDEGFDVKVGIDLKTGFVYGGNEHNCGTWMDKMGESERAKTKGIPATPRDGSAVELIGLCKSAVSWLQRANNSGQYPYDGVFTKDKDKVQAKLTWSQWNGLIAENFEQHFYVGDNDSSQLVHKRYIYKDTIGASHPWCDYQLRPNFPVAMVYAPEMFDVDHAWRALEIAQAKLLGPLGMKTLDPDDMQYRGDYDNGNDSEDRSVAHGFNYHQGPEWLWPVGYFLRAKLHFARKLGPEKLKETVDFIRSFIVNHQLYLENSPWCGLPELTNSNGSYCRDSCPIQAWSHATLLDLLCDMSQL
ncbi:glycogen debranching enzyme-like [Clavelina lepadiformis]|uniref:glycogen debranching enzyme-like n=1 Tax=Clavelina lepadiformis TaxID=159417 RepID=UPI0040424464